MTAPTVEALQVELAQARAEIADLRKAKAELYRETTHDELTGLLNRKGIKQVWASDAVTSIDALALLDIDGFKQINDTYGHAAGDAVLQHVAGGLLDQWRIAGRRSGDELVIIDGRSSLEWLAEMGRPVWRVPLPGGPTIPVSVSVGVTRAVSPLPLTLARADLALYRSKRNRQVCWWSEEVDGDPVIVDRPAQRRRDTPVGVA